MDIAISCMVATVSISSNECMPDNELLIDCEWTGQFGISVWGALHLSTIDHIVVTMQEVAM